MRFRTPIREREEIDFVILVIASSIAAVTTGLCFPLVPIIVAIVSLPGQRAG